MIISFIKKNKKLFFWISVAIVFITIFFLQYYSPLRGDYIVPPGDDPYNHLSNINALETKGFFEVFRSGGYPPGFHYLVAKVSDLTGVDPLRVMVLMYPSIFIAISAVVFLFSYLIFGPKVGIISLLLYGFTQNAHLQLQNDGGYPNLIAGGVFLPLLILAVVYSFKKSAYFLIPALILLTAIFLTHHLTTLYLIGLFIVSSFISIIYFWISNKWSYKKGLLFILIYLGLLSLFFYQFQNSSIFAPARGLFGVMIEFTNRFPFFETVFRGKSSILPLYLYDDNLVKMIFIFGLIGIPYAFYIYLKNQKNYYFPLILIAVWIIVFMSVSQMSFLSDPGRAMRDLTIPLVIFAAILLADIFTRFNDKKIGVFLFVICAYFWLWPSLSQRFVVARSYEPMVRITQADIGAIKLIDSASQDNQRIFTNVTHPWLRKFMSTYPITVTNKNLKSAKLVDGDIIYKIDNQMSWSSVPINYEFTKKIPAEELELLGQFSSPINNISIYRIVK